MPAPMRASRNDVVAGRHARRRRGGPCPRTRSRRRSPRRCRGEGAAHVDARRVGQADALRSSSAAALRAWSMRSSSASCDVLLTPSISVSPGSAAITAHRERDRRRRARRYPSGSTRAAALSLDRAASQSLQLNGRRRHHAGVDLVDPAFLLGRVLLLDDGGDVAAAANDPAVTLGSASATVRRASCRRLPRRQAGSGYRRGPAARRRREPGWCRRRRAGAGTAAGRGRYRVAAPGARRRARARRLPARPRPRRGR